jgi:hypothetical protein
MPVLLTLRQVMWWDSDERLRSPLSQSVLQWLQGCEQRAVVIGWGASEIGVVGALAQHAAAIHASDWAVNLASYTSFYSPVLQQRQPQPLPPPTANEHRHTVSFLMSDGDNLQVRQPLLDKSEKLCVTPAAAVAGGWRLCLAGQRLVGQQRTRRRALGLDHQPRTRRTGTQHNAALLSRSVCGRCLRCWPLWRRVHVP